MLRTALLILVLIVGGCGEERHNVVAAHGEPELMLMDFSAPFPLDPLPPGWRHRTFWTRAPMAMSFASKDGVAAMRFETQASASMLFRHVDLALDDYPILAWLWYIEEPIASAIDERTRAGDDHPARFFLVFRTQGGEERRMEIVWGNKILHAGDYKYIGSFPHYVADGGDENIRQWRHEEIDLRPIIGRIWPGEAKFRLSDIAVFCDSDETGGHTVSYVAQVRALRRSP